VIVLGASFAEGALLAFGVMVVLLAGPGDA